LLNFDQFSFTSNIKDAIQAAGFFHPTPIQKEAIPLVLQGRDVLGIAQTGTGKTAAFVLPILQHLHAKGSRKPRVLIIEPTRELAEQVHRSIADLRGKSRVHSATIYGGMSRKAQVSNLQRGAEIIVACPGRFLDLVDQGDVDVSSIEILVMDEADRLSDRIAIIDHGKMVVLDTPPRLKDTLEGDVVAVRTNNIDKLSELVTKWLGFPKTKIVDGALEITVRNGKVVMPRIMELATQNNIYVESIMLREPNLEDVFLHYTGKSIREDTGKELHGASAARRRAIK